MPCSLFSRTRGLFSFSSPTRKCQIDEQALDDEKDVLFQKERASLHEGQDEEMPFPCPAFINTASKYILSPTPSQYIPTPKTSSFSSTNRQTCSSSSSSSTAKQARGIDLTPLAQAFADLAVDAGIYGTRESYVEVLAFQLRRIVRSLVGQCWDLEGDGGAKGRGRGRGRGGCLTLTVTRPELNCTVDITVQTRRRNILHHPLLSFLNRIEEEQVVLVALNPLVCPKSSSVERNLEHEQVEVRRKEAGGVFSTWWLKETRFGCLENDTGEVKRNEIGKGDREGEVVQAKRRWRWNIAQGRDAWWDLYGCCSRRWGLEDGYHEGGSEHGRHDLDRDQPKGKSKGARRSSRGRKSRTEVLVGENGEFDFTCERRRGIW